MWDCGSWGTGQPESGDGLQEGAPECPLDPGRSPAKGQTARRGEGTACKQQKRRFLFLLNYFISTAVKWKRNVVRN